MTGLGLQSVTIPGPSRLSLWEEGPAKHSPPSAILPNPIRHQPPKTAAPFFCLGSVSSCTACTVSPQFLASWSITQPAS